MFLDESPAVVDGDDHARSRQGCAQGEGEGEVGVESQIPTGVLVPWSGNRSEHTISAPDEDVWLTEEARVVPLRRGLEGLEQVRVQRESVDMDIVQTVGTGTGTYRAVHANNACNTKET